VRVHALLASQFLYPTDQLAGKERIVFPARWVKCPPRETNIVENAWQVNWWTHSQVCGD